MYYVYILKSQKDLSLYIGNTMDIKNRLSEHNSGESKYSKTKKPYSLIWFCAFPNKTRAISFEKYLKHGSGHAFVKRHLV